MGDGERPPADDSRAAPYTIPEARLPYPGLLQTLLLSHVLVRPQIMHIEDIAMPDGVTMRTRTDRWTD